MLKNGKLEEPQMVSEQREAEGKEKDEKENEFEDERNWFSKQSKEILQGI